MCVCVCVCVCEWVCEAGLFDDCVVASAGCDCDRVTGWVVDESQYEHDPSDLRSQ